LDLLVVDKHGRRASKLWRAGVFAKELATPVAKRHTAGGAAWCDVQTRVVSGVPHRAILSTTLGIKPDLIVMGLPARSALDIVFMGSTTSPVLRGAQCPVLTVPVPVGMFESQTLMTSSRAPELDSDNYSMVAGRASQANPIEGLVSW
jgi:nucleotide-binding universal stress UspA family protein